MQLASFVRQSEYHFWILSWLTLSKREPCFSYVLERTIPAPPLPAPPTKTPTKPQKNPWFLIAIPLYIDFLLIFETKVYFSWLFLSSCLPSPFISFPFAFYYWFVCLFVFLLFILVFFLSPFSATLPIPLQFSFLSSGFLISAIFFS